MDPISAAASLISIIQLVGVFVDYANQAKNAPRERRILAVECANLQMLLTNLNFRLEDCNQNEQWYMAVQPMLAAGGALDQFAALLQKLESRLQEKKGFGKAAWQTLVWPFDKAEMLEVIATIERLKSLINTALTTEIFSLSSDIKEGVDSVRHSMDILLSAKEASRKKQQVQRQRDIFTGLQAVDNGSKQARVYKERCEATGLWLTDTVQMKSFLEADRGILWVFGKSGCGKSTLASAFIDQTITNPKSKGSRTAYHYCSSQDAKSQTIEAVIGSLVYQLCVQSEDAMALVENEFSAQKSSSSLRREPAIIVFENLLDQVLRALPQTVLVIDAIDECEQKNDLIKLLRQIHEFDRVKIFATGRPEPDIRRAAAEFQHSNIIDVKPQDIIPDVRLFVQLTLSQNDRWALLDSAIKNLIVSTLSDQANGMFRWVRCQLDELEKVRSRSAIKDALKTLPRDLEETYDRQISSLNAIDRAILCKALIWLSFCERPLSLKELAEVVSLDNSFRTVNPDDRLMDASEILEISQGLIVDLKAGGHVLSTFPHTYQISKTDVYVGLAHHSVRDFLFSARGLQHFGLYAVDFTHAQSYLCRTCLLYLLMEDFDNGPCRDGIKMEARLNEYPFLEYASFYWSYHFRKIQDLSEDVWNLTMEFMGLPKSAKFMSWIQTIAYRKRSRVTAVRYSENSTPLYYAASFGLGRVVSELLNRGADVNERGGTYGGTPLIAALYRRHRHVARLLLQAGANPDIADLRASAFDVQYLMDKVDPNLRKYSRSNEWKPAFEDLEISVP